MLTFRVLTKHYRGRDYHMGIIEGGARRKVFSTKKAGYIALHASFQDEECTWEELLTLTSQIAQSVLSNDGSDDETIGELLESYVAEEKVNPHLM